MRRRSALRLALASVLTAGAPGRAGRGQIAGAPDPPRRPDVIYVPTPAEVVDRMLEVAGLKPGDVLYDLGCGDGRIVVAAARRYGVRAVGLDIDPKRVAESRANARKSGVIDRVTIRQQDLFAADLSGASVVTLYLLPNLNARLMPRLARLRAGARVVCHSFALPKVRAVRVVKVPLEKGGFRTVYLYRVPWESEPVP